MKAEVDSRVATLQQSRQELTRAISPAYRSSHSKELFASLRTGETRRVKEILKFHPKLAHEVDSTMQTPLHWATRRNNYEVMRLLLNLGANPKADDLVGRTPFDIAKHKRHVAASRLLEIALL
jgi:membrane-bound lytic murein transglycosylase MltF